MKRDERSRAASTPSPGGDASFGQAGSIPDDEAAWRWERACLLPGRRMLLVDGHDSRIGARAFDLLVALVERRARVVGKDELFSLVWHDVVVEDNNLAVHVAALRRVLGAAAITTVPGRGYRFTAPLTRAQASARVAVAGDVAASGVAVEGVAMEGVMAGDSAPGDVTPRDVAPDDVAPALPATLYGRDEDAAALVRQLRAHRLVTLVGPGGIGKTALVPRLADALRDAHPEGVRRVDLAPVSDPAWVLPAVAAALDVALPSPGDATALAHAARDRRALLVLDNCEHLLQPVAEVAEALLRVASRLRLLATSQEPLRIAGEQVYRLPPLGLPVAGGLEAARAAGAVALFEARARAALPGFALGESDVEAAAEICRRLDGLPLAIEFAAARVPLLGVQGVREQLDERFALLTRGARLALPRHQTLRAALDWSHELLTLPERAVLRRLGVASGSFGLALAIDIAGDACIGGWELVDHLGALVDKSLVAVEPGEPPRYRLLETTRAFALEKLAEAGEQAAAADAHLRAVLACFERSRAEEFEIDLATRLARYLPELDNARAALAHAQASGRVEARVALAGAMAWLWVDAGLRPEGLARLRAALAVVDARTPAALEARLLAAWSWVASPVNGPGERRAESRAIALYRAIGDRRALFAGLCRLATLQAYDADLAPAERGVAEAESLFDPGWPPELRARLLLARGWLRLCQSRHAEGIATYEALLALARAAGNRQLAMVALVNAEQAVAALGQHDEAARRGHEMLALLGEQPDMRGGCESLVRTNLSMALTLAGRVEEALAVARAALPVARRVGRLVDLVEQGALLALLRGRLEAAARAAGRALAGFAATHTQRDVVERGLHERLHTRLHALLPGEALARLFAEGAALDDEAAIRGALAD